MCIVPQCFLLIVPILVIPGRSKHLLCTIVFVIYSTLLMKHRENPFHQPTHSRLKITQFCCAIQHPLVPSLKLMSCIGAELSTALLEALQNGQNRISMKQ